MRTYATTLLTLALCAPLAGCVPTNFAKAREANEVHLAQEGLTALKAGDPAPPITADSTAGLVTVPAVAEDDQPAGETLLYFYPADFTPNSARNLADMSALLPLLAERHIQVYGVTVGDLEQHRQFAAKYNIKVPLVADNGTACIAYGAMASGGAFPQRTWVQVGADGKVALYRRGVMHLPELKKELGLTEKQQ